MVDIKRGKLVSDPIMGERIVPTDTPAPSTGLAERLASQILMDRDEGDVPFTPHGAAAEAVRRTIALAAGVVGEMAEERITPGLWAGSQAQREVYQADALREAERRIMALLDGEEGR